MEALVTAQEGKSHSGQQKLPSTGDAVLVVDDEPIILTSATEILSREGYRVDTSENPLEALERLEKKPYAVIFSDQRMPSMKGLEFLDRARKLQPDAARVLITGVIEMSLVIEADRK